MAVSAFRCSDYSGRTKTGMMNLLPLCSAFEKSSQFVIVPAAPHRPDILNEPKLQAQRLLIQFMPHRLTASSAHRVSSIRGVGPFEGG